MPPGYSDTSWLPQTLGISTTQESFGRILLVSATGSTSLQWAPFKFWAACNAWDVGHQSCRIPTIWVSTECKRWPAEFFWGYPRSQPWNSWHNRENDENPLKWCSILMWKERWVLHRIAPSLQAIVDKWEPLFYLDIYIYIWGFPLITENPFEMDDLVVPPFLEPYTYKNIYMYIYIYLNMHIYIMMLHVFWNRI